MLYPLSSNSWNKKEAAVFQQVLEKGRFTMGDSVKEFERAEIHFDTEEYWAEC